MLRATSSIILFSLVFGTPLAMAADPCVRSARELLSTLSSQKFVTPEVALKLLKREAGLSSFLALKISAQSSWEELKLAGLNEKAWIAHVKVLDLGPQHLAKDFKASEIAHIKVGQTLPVVVYGKHAPLLRDDYAYNLGFRETDFKLNKDVSFVDVKTKKPLLVMNGIDKPEPQSASEFRAWTKSERRDLLESGDLIRFGKIHHQEIKNLDEVLKTLDPKSDLAKALNKAQEHFMNNVNMDIEPEYGDLPLILIGKTQLSADVFRHADGELLGVRIHAFQKGALYPDEADPDSVVDDAVREARKRYFDTLEEAIAEGADESDVSWAASSTLEFNKGRMIDHNTDEFMDWTGF